MSDYPLLEHKIMTAMVQKFPTPPQFLGKQLFPEDPIDGNVAEWDIVSRSRTMAPYSVPDAEAHILKRVTVAHQTATIAQIRIKKQLKGSSLAWLRKPGTEHENYRQDAVRDELLDLDTLAEYRREWARWQALSGTLAYSASDVKFSINYGIDASHKPTVNANWSLAGTDIISDIRIFKRLITDDAGEVPAKVYCGEKVMEYLLKNNGVKSLMGDQLKTQLLESGYIKRLLGLDWNVYDLGYIDDNGAFQRFIPDDYLVMVPAPTPAAATNFADEKVGACTDPESNFAVGKFSKSWTQKDPAGIWVLEENNVIPVIKKVEAIVYARVNS